MIKPGDVPPRGGLYLLDVVPDGEVRFGFPNISDNAEIVELIACGSHVILFTTGRGSVVGSAISPVIKICANPDTYRRMADDMDVDAGRILEGRATLDEVGREIFDLVLRVGAGEPTDPKQLGHQEFILTYKTFEPIGPALPARLTKRKAACMSAAGEAKARRARRRAIGRFDSHRWAFEAREEEAMQNVVFFAWRTVRSPAASGRQRRALPAVRRLSRRAAAERRPSPRRAAWSFSMPTAAT